MRLSPVWAAAMVVAAGASAVTIHRRAGQVTWDLHLSTITALLLALIWLPSLVRVVALTGGGLKAAGSEVAAGGLISQFGHLREPLTTVIAAVEGLEAKVPAAQRAKVRELRDELEVLLASVLPRDLGEVLDRAARQYEEVRQQMPPGTDRTFQLAKTVIRARGSAVNLDDPQAEARRRFQTGSDGDRIVALAIAEMRPSRGFYDMALNALEQPRSEFERFHALVALGQMIPFLDASQSKQLTEVIAKQRQAGKATGTGITPSDEDMWTLSGEVLENLRAGTSL